ncbi:Epimerase family protein SDR39U1 like, chloroplastic [Schistosoma japonicum]|nr:Epimerase family protein SDR39U1 like, chloroplastic [Schistosoma japonicum]
MRYDVVHNSIKQSGLPKNVDVVVNLSGRSIGEVNASFLIKQNYDRYIQEVFSSRLDTTKLLVDLSKGTPLKAFINASAIGIVLAKDSNFIRSLYLSHRMGFCNPIGTGRQWISWIHIHDLIRIIEYITDPESVFSSGPVNCTAPEPVRQVTLAKALSESLGASFNPLSKIPIPPFIFNYLLGKDRATLVVDGQRVVPTKLLNSGFKFTYPNLADAFENIFGHRPCL